MAIISRQTGLLAAENWKKIYQTFREADFTTYDFETLRKSMIDYIKIYILRFFWLIGNMKI